MSAGIYTLDRSTHDALVTPLREFGLALTSPLRWVASWPQRRRQAALLADNQAQLESDYLALRERLMELETSLAQLNALRAENNRLRRLLQATAELPVEVQVVDISRMQLFPFDHRLVLEQGRKQGISEGTPVLSASGVLGQVQKVSANESVVVLATEAEQAIPAMVVRNAGQTIVHGLGQRGLYRVSWLPQNTDIREGDLLVTSGLGGRFPAGFPIAVVASVEAQPGERFLKVFARPTADVTDQPEVLLVRNSKASTGE
nr:rod shape-determining protein MreC [Oceanococcus sp. HetDA_MAG_MS8]